MTSRAHWDRIHREKDPATVSWYQPRPEDSLELIRGASLGGDARILDVGGGTSFLVDGLLDAGFSHLGVLDISVEAIQQTRERLGDRGGVVEWHVGDVTMFRSERPWDLWHDRAVFHFLTEERQRLAYVESLRTALGPAGKVVLATFGPDGPTKCSGLPVVSYDARALADVLGRDFELEAEALRIHVTPAGAGQQFLFTRFRRV